MSTRTRGLLVAAVLSLGSAAAASAADLTGDYVEARTASVFAGPCHYSGEYVSDGREAVAAWHVTHGAYNGVALDGLKAVAVVRADDNLGKPGAARSSMLYLDSTATPAQRAALESALKARAASGLGEIRAVATAHIRYAHGDEIVVDAPGVASLDIAPLPNHECCKQPSLVWYAPLAPVEGRMVGFTKTASCTARTGGDAWQRSDENGAFYGTFRY